MRKMLKNFFLIICLYLSFACFTPANSALSSMELDTWSTIVESGDKDYSTEISDKKADDPEIPNLETNEEPDPWG